MLVPQLGRSFRRPTQSNDAVWVSATFGRGGDTVGNPRRGQISQFELFELILLLNLDKHFPVEQFEATVSQSTVPSTPLTQTGPRNAARASKLLPDVGSWRTANLRATILDFRGFDSSRILIRRGWNSNIQWEFPGIVESANLSRNDLSREIGCVFVQTLWEIL